MSDSIQCLCCYSSLESHAKPPSRLTLRVIGQQLVECSMGCNIAVKVGFYQKHLQSQCQSHYEHSIHSPSRTTVLKILDRQVDAPTIGATIHLLEDHTVPWLKRWLLGAGLMGEQGLNLFTPMSRSLKQTTRESQTDWTCYNTSINIPLHPVYRTCSLL